MSDTRCSAPGCANHPKVFALLSTRSGTTDVAVCAAHVRALGMDYLLRDPKEIDADRLAHDYEQCKLHAVLFKYDPDEFTVVLRGSEGRSVFAAQVGYPEAAAIYNAAKKVNPEAIGPHQLVLSVIRTLGSSPLEAVIRSYDSPTGAYRCYLRIATPASILEVTCRPSDAVAVCLWSDIPFRIRRDYLGRDVHDDVSPEWTTW